MIKHSGVADLDLVQGVYPSEERRKKGAFAVIECFQRIPCNPCFSSCKREAIFPLIDINDLPKADFDKCNGCGLCMSACPGLAIFIIDETFSEKEALIKLPYEFLPLPAIGDVVSATDREGKFVCKAAVKQVSEFKNTRTPIITLVIPKEQSMNIRGISLDTTIDKSSDDLEKADCTHCDCIKIDEIDEKTSGAEYICRCEEITVGEIRDYIAKGYTSLNEIKIISRAGMGACQGRTCRQLILNELSKATGQPIDKMPKASFRPPVKPIKLSLLLKEETEVNGDNSF